MCIPAEMRARNKRTSIILQNFVESFCRPWRGRCACVRISNADTVRPCLEYWWVVLATRRDRVGGGWRLARKDINLTMLVYQRSAMGSAALSRPTAVAAYTSPTEASHAQNTLRHTYRARFSRALRVLVIVVGEKPCPRPRNPVRTRRLHRRIRYKAPEYGR